MHTVTVCGFALWLLTPWNSLNSDVHPHHQCCCRSVPILIGRKAEEATLTAPGLSHLAVLTGARVELVQHGKGMLYMRNLRKQAKRKRKRSPLIHKKLNHHNRSSFSVCDCTATLVTFASFLKGCTLHFLLKEAKRKEQLSCKKHKNYLCGCRENCESATHSGSKTRKQITTVHHCLKKTCSFITISWLWESLTVLWVLGTGNTPVPLQLCSTVWTCLWSLLLSVRATSNI